MTRKSGIDNLKTPNQLDLMFETAAKIKDPKLAVQMAYLLIVASIFGARPGETLHSMEQENVIRSKVNGEIVFFRIPRHIDIESSYATELAKRSSSEDCDFVDLNDQEYQSDGWSCKSDAANRLIPVLREREREVIEIFFSYYGSPLEEFEHPNTLLRRFRRLAELTDGVDAAYVTSQGMRASCAVYWANLNMDPHYLQQMFGWKYLTTAYYYIMVSGMGLRDEMMACLDIERSSAYDVEKDPKTFVEIRENADQLIEVKNVTPNTDQAGASFPTGGKGGDPLEAHAQSALDEFSDTSVLTDRFPVDDGAYAAADPVSPLVAARVKLVTNRLERERQMIEQHPDPDIGFEKRRTAAAAGGMLLGSVLMGTSSAANGLLADVFAGDTTALLSLGFAGAIALPYMVWSTHDLMHDDPEEVEPETLLDRVIMTTHAAVDPVASKVSKYIPDWFKSD